MKFSKFSLALLFIIQSAYPDVTAADARALVMQNDAKLVSAGSVTKNKQNILALIRYGATGSVDTSFGIDGISTLLVGQQTEANAIALQSDGKIVVGGFSIFNNSTRALIARYTTAGVLDSSFGIGSTGYCLESLDATQIADVKIQSDGKIIVCGTQSIEGQLQSFIVRYTSDGLRDVTFGNNGLVTALVGFQSGALGLALQSDGKIVICGFTVEEKRKILLMRYTSDGNIDTTYGVNGLIATAIGESAQAEALFIDTNDNAVIAGISDNSFLVCRYTIAGILDTNFGISGMVIQSIGNRSCAYNICTQTDGKIVACGFADNSLVIIRCSDQGTLDAGFGVSGIVTDSVVNTVSTAKAIVYQADGKIVVVGSADDDLIAIRYDGDGTRDLSWGFDGVIDTDDTFQNPVTLVVDAKASGVDGGTFTAGSWITRELNTIISDSTNVELGTNSFTLQPGIYEISIAAPAYMCGNHKIRLQNTTAHVTEKHGTAAFSSSTTEGSVSNSLLEVTLIVASPTVYEIQHRCSATKTGNGFGIATGFDDSEVYTIVKINEK